MDLGISLAPFLYKAATGERERQVEGQRWQRLARLFEARDRKRAAAAEPKMIIVEKPAHLAGPQRLA